MKKTNRIVILILISTLLVLIVCKMYKIENEKNETSNMNTYMPEFKFNVLNNSEFNNDSLNNFKKKTIINYFNAHCDFCYHEIKDIISHKHLFPNTGFLLVSDQHTDTLIAFNKALKIDSFSSINICQVDYLDFVKKFGDVVPPTTFVYDSNKRLIKKYKGQIRAPVVADDIKKYYTKINE